MRKNLGFISVILLMLTACYPDLVLDQNKSMPDQVWNWKDEARFEMNVEDTNSLYDLGINVRINDDYPYQNLWVKLKSKTPSGDSSFARVELQLFEPGGIPLGHQKGNVWEYHVPAIKGMSFRELGTFEFFLEQNMRVNNLPGILDVGIFIEKSGDNF